MKIEWWKFIPGFDCKYMVSDYGRVLSLNYNRTGKIKILKQTIDNGYYRVTLRNKNKQYCPKVHRLVAEAFIDNPTNLPCVNHKNEFAKTDNRVSNLEWCDWKYNINYGTALDRMAKNRQIPVNQYSKEGVFIAQYPSALDAQNATGVSRCHICSCCKNKSGFKTAGGFKWSYV